jgi:hypothetical protein
LKKSLEEWSHLNTHASSHAMGISPKKITALLNERKHRILLVAEASLPRGQFQAFRKVVLRELGQDGLEHDLTALLAGHRLGMDGNGQDKILQERRSDMIDRQQHDPTYI